jgi:phage terminase small subunit
VKGRRPKPSLLKLVTGNPGKRPVNRAEPKPASGGLPTTPGELADESKIEWRRVAQALHRLGLLTRVDRAALAAYCQVYRADARRASAGRDGRARPGDRRAADQDVGQPDSANKR